jgi:hypothetical protein
MMWKRRNVYVNVAHEGERSLLLAVNFSRCVYSQARSPNVYVNDTHGDERRRRRPPLIQVQKCLCECKCFMVEEKEFLILKLKLNS